MKYSIFTYTMPGFDSVGMVADRNLNGFKKFRTSQEAFKAANRRNWSFDGGDCQCVAKRIGGRWIVVHQLPVVYAE